MSIACGRVCAYRANSPASWRWSQTAKWSLGPAHYRNRRNAGIAGCQPSQTLPSTAETRAPSSSSIRTSSAAVLNRRAPVAVLVRLGCMPLTTRLVINPNIHRATNGIENLDARTGLPISSHSAAGADAAPGATPRVQSHILMRRICAAVAQKYAAKSVYEGRNCCAVVANRYAAAAALNSLMRAYRSCIATSWAFR